jgi:signal transduction histidine kinase
VPRFSILSNETEKFEPVDLNSLLFTIVADYEMLIEKLEARAILGELPVNEAIPFQMNQLFSNLLSNALKFVCGGAATKDRDQCERCSGS